MCHINPLMNKPMSSKRYDTWERNKQHERIVDCNSCTCRKRRRCHHKFARDNIGTNSNKLPPTKLLKIKGRTKRNQPAPEIKGRLLRRHGFKIEFTGKTVGGRKQSKVTPIIYGRLVDRYSQQIHE